LTISDWYIDVQTQTPSYSVEFSMVGDRGTVDIYGTPTNTLFYGSGSDPVWGVDFTTTPEPGGIALLGIGCAGLMCALAKKKTSQDYPAWGARIIQLSLEIP
jgi:hypothetical protein